MNHKYYIRKMTRFKRIFYIFFIILLLSWMHTATKSLASIFYATVAVALQVYIINAAAAHRYIVSKETDDCPLILPETENELEELKSIVLSDSVYNKKELATMLTIFIMITILSTICYGILAFFSISNLILFTLWLMECCCFMFATMNRLKILLKWIIHTRDVYGISNTDKTGGKNNETDTKSCDSNDK